MIIIGLTGSIGMGKTTAAGMLRGLGCAVHDADAAVHSALGPGGKAVEPVVMAFSNVFGEDGGVNRPALGQRVFGDPVALKQLEGILHPIVAEERDRFLKAQIWRGRQVAVLDVPLLFETGGQARCDWTFVVTAPAAIQEQRVLARPGMTRSRLMEIRARQMPDSEKRMRCDSLIWTSLGRAETLHQLKRALKLACDNAAFIKGRKIIDA